ncbi:MAG TPA: cyclopropane-fatty-acyl-phospholipid synthase family protein [Solirubrobacterales bacterium]|nr:cyclopropane-fatty-acyl-phospholipid synthase family protein [Solirubrobacterales bacterium]
MWRRLALSLIGRVRGGRIEIVEGDRVTTVGDPGSDLRARVVVHSPRLWRRMLRGSTGLAESYLRREWDCDDLVALATIAGLNLPRLDSVRRRLRFVTGPAQRLGPLMPRTTRARGRRQIAAHYDLGNGLFSLFLDPSMNYSSAVYRDPEDDLETAQIQKMDQIADRLELGPEHHLLEIGTGWGGLAIHLAARSGCRITTTTISREQAVLARERIARAGLSDTIEVVEVDYRDLTGEYDRLVSIEMIEAVGWKDFPTYFRQCSSLLKPDGAMLLQAITIDDDAYELEKASRSFISHYIFPGGCLPSLREIDRCLATETDLRTAWSSDIGLDYARTLSEWRGRFLAEATRLDQLGYDERFRRMWTLYLTFAEGGFRSRRNSDFQILLAKPEFMSAPARPRQADMQF